jgi:two-component system, NtrC family, response regulator AtoC
VGTFIDLLLSEKHISYAIFDSSFNLVKKSKNLYANINHSSDDDNSIYNILPEFFGLERELEQLISGVRKELILQKVNKSIQRGQLIYLDYLALPFNETEPLILVVITNSTEQSNLEQKIQQQNNEIKILKENISNLKNDAIRQILGRSDEIETVKKFITKVADIKETTILLTGESGTGKTFIAKGIHNYSKYSDTPFVEINCAAIPSTLIESELFGHIKGAYTGAVENKKGLLEEADGGTLFLDEIGELPINIQPKFLSFLESKKFRPVGTTKEISVNTRIIAATNKDLKKAVFDKDFREDLFYRINVISLDIPSLRERVDDILLIAQKFIEILSLDFNKYGITLSDSAKEKLLCYSWPGNIRELKNCIERAMIFCESKVIDASDLLISESDSKVEKAHKHFLPENGVSLVDIERKYLEEAIKKSNGNQTKAAKLLGLSLDTFRYRIKKYNLTL